jgi:hypothetical protein
MYFVPQVVLLDDALRRQLLRAFTEDERLHVEEVSRLLRLVQVGRRLAAFALACAPVCSCLTLICGCNHVNAAAELLRGWLASYSA